MLTTKVNSALYLNEPGYCGPISFTTQLHTTGSSWTSC